MGQKLNASHPVMMVRDLMIDVCNERLEEGADGKERRLAVATRYLLWNRELPSELLNPELYDYYMLLYKTTSNAVYGTVAWG